MQNLPAQPPPGPDLLADARQRITKRLELTGQQVPLPLVDDAAELLACIWRCGYSKGVTVADWRYASIRLDQAVIDALTIRPDGSH